MNIRVNKQHTKVYIRNLMQACLLQTYNVIKTIPEDYPCWHTLHNLNDKDSRYTVHVCTEDNAASSKDINYETVKSILNFSNLYDITHNSTDITDDKINYILDKLNSAE